MLSRGLASALAIALLAANAAADTEGAIEINAVRAGVGGINGDPLADPPGFPVIITQPGSYRLTSNLAGGGTSEPLISVRAPNVWLDLAGFALSAGLHGIDSSEANVTVVNGSIYGMTDFGIWVQGDRARVERVRTFANGSDGIDLTGEGSFVGDSIAIGNGTSGGVGIFVVSGTIYRCIVNSNGYGLALYVGDFAPGANVVSESVALGNGVGISMEDSSALENLIVGNTGAGIDALTRPPGWVSGYASTVLSANGPAVKGAAIKTGPNLCNGALCP